MSYTVREENYEGTVRELLYKHHYCQEEFIYSHFLSVNTYYSHGSTTILYPNRVTNKYDSLKKYIFLRCFGLLWF